MSKRSRYTALLVRWQDDGSQTRWQSTVENAYTGERHHFSDRNELLRFLWHALFGGETPGPAGDGGKPDQAHGRREHDADG